MSVPPQISTGWKVWLTCDAHSWENWADSSVSQTSFFNWLAQSRSHGKGEKAIAGVTPANILLTKESHMTKLSVMEWYKELQIYMVEGMN